jgi:hypothetical protein
MEKIISGKDFRNLLEIKEQKKNIEDRLDELIKEAEAITWETARDLDREIFCNQGMKTCKVTQVGVEITVKPYWEKFELAAKIYLTNKPGDEVLPHHWKSYIEKITFNDGEHKIKMEDDFHWPEITFKTEEDFKYFKGLVEIIKGETNEIIGALTEKK